MIRRFKERGTEKLAKRAASREKRLAAMEVDGSAGAGERDRMKTPSENFQSGKDVLLAGDLSKRFGYDGRGRSFRRRRTDSCFSTWIWI